jgi:archaellum biogenesis ATPase FlaH/5S rRNA maturation endonuclease (ribonuclease M5)
MEEQGSVTNIAHILTGSGKITPYEEYEKALYSYKTNDKAKEALIFLRKTRGLKLETLQNFHIGYNERMHEVAMPIFKDSELIDYKFRKISEKGFRRVSGGATWAFNDKAFETSKEDGYIVITEGEIDCMTVYQYGIKSVVSVTSGATGSTPWIDRVPPEIKIYINFDSDEVGQEAAYKLASKIGLERCYNVALPTKDANEFLTTGHTAEDYKHILKNSPRFNLKDIYMVVDVIDQLSKHRLRRIPVFLERLTDEMNGGIPNQSLVTISGKTGEGKSSFLLNLLVGHANAGKPVMLISLENDLYFTVQRILEIKYKKPYTLFTADDWIKIKDEMMDYPFYIDTSMESYTLARISEILRQSKRLYGVEFFGFDHIGFLPTRDEHKEISQMVRGFKMMAREHDMVIYMISHVRRSKDSNNVVTTDDLKGASSIGQDSDIVLVVYSTKEGSYISIDKARMSQSKRNIPIIFDGSSGVMEDDRSRSVRHYDEEVPDTIPHDNEFAKAAGQGQ